MLGDEVKGLEIPLLDVRDLRVGFGGREAVRGVSFSIGAGETLGLVGESGSGKSATSFAVMGLLGSGAAVSGSVRLGGAVPPGLKPVPFNADGGLTGTDGGVELLGLGDRGMRRVRGKEVAMVFQEPMTALNPVMTVGRQIGEALLAHYPKTPRAEVKARVVAAMREVGLPEPERRMKEYPHQFSGGQRQRIVIAMALMNQPRLLIADEPTTALDVTVQAQVLALLKQLKERHGLGMLFISHDLAVVAQVADRVAVMRGGEIVEMGTVERVMTRPEHPYTRALLASAPTMRTERGRPLATV
jgi:peptide/nickel transport system ATP-binding protein